MSTVLHVIPQLIVHDQRRDLLVLSLIGAIGVVLNVVSLYLLIKRIIQIIRYNY